VITRNLPLLLANLARQPVRISLTAVSIAVAFTLFGVLHAVDAAFTGAVQLAGADRLVTFHRVSRIQAMPLAHVERIRALPGVRAACPHVWFGGMYRSERDPVLTYAVDPQSFLEVFPEYSLPDAAAKRWLAERDSAIVGSAIAERFGWKTGDIVPLMSNIYTSLAGSRVWQVRIAGIYHAPRTENVSVYLRYDYFNGSHTYDRDVIGWVVTRARDADQVDLLGEHIDAAFANSGAETATNSESLEAEAMTAQFGSISALIMGIAAAVFVIMLLITMNTMSQSIRERTREIGILKALGFPAYEIDLLIVVETVLLVAVGALVGLLLSNAGAHLLSASVQEFFPFLYVPPQAYWQGAAVAVAVGVVSAAMPCVYARRLTITDALRVV
jgi:putative ABC transport system permease protein